MPRRRHHISELKILKDVELIPVASLPSIPVSERKKLPYISAVYFAVDEDQKNLLYWANNESQEQNSCT